MKFNFVYMTATDKAEAERIAGELVETRLAACVNIIENMSSVYWWRGRVETGREVVLIAKTRARLVDALIEKVRSIHSYECPCVVSLPILGGNGAFLAWIENETFNPNGEPQGA